MSLLEQTARDHSAHLIRPLRQKHLKRFVPQPQKICQGGGTSCEGSGLIDTSNSKFQFKRAEKDSSSHCSGDSEHLTVTRKLPTVSLLAPVSQNLAPLEWTTDQTLAADVMQNQYKVYFSLFSTLFCILKKFPATKETRIHSFCHSLWARRHFPDKSTLSQSENGHTEIFLKNGQSAFQHVARMRAH